jgi:hypothetical protein
MADSKFRLEGGSTQEAMSIDEPTPQTSTSSVASNPIGHHIGLFGTVTLIVGRVVGSGIFASPGPLFAQVNSVGMALVLWTITGLISAVGGEICSNHKFHSYHLS